MKGVAKWLVPLFWLAGLGDTLTGVGLLLLPAVTLRLMGLSALPAELVLVRFIGVFVSAVGCSYLFALLSRGSARQRRLLTVLELTTVVRAAVALFVVTAVVRAALEPAWLSVAATDGLIAGLQLRLLRQGEDCAAV